jgi:hypothetical protein
MKKLEPRPFNPYFQYGGERKKMCPECVASLKIKVEDLSAKVAHN